MKQLKQIIRVIAAMLALVGCSSGDPERMLWECPAYDQTEISVQFTPEYYMQGQIIAKAGYSGEITLVCVNYPEIFIETNSFDLEKIGCTATQTGKNSVKLAFKPVVLPDGATVTTQFALTGKNKSETTVYNLQIGRQP